ncbi:MAG TPA: hypothetical protein V6D02_15245 [Candidatus Obscuribacterales bacterium]
MKVAQTALAAIALLSSGPPLAAQALPPPDDIPEEILRTEIILDARSPLTGEPLTAAAYAQLQASLSHGPPPTPPAELRELIFLLQIRRVLKPVIPLLP